MQPWILVGAAVLLLWQFVRGWQLGVVRQVANIIGLAAAGVAGYFGGPLAAPLLAPMPLSDQAAPLVAGAVIGLVLFACIAGLGAIVFRSTSQQPIRLVRWIYGLSGAVIGVAFGLALVWAGVVVFRTDSELAGLLREFRLQAAVREIGK